MPKLLETTILTCTFILIIVLTLTMLSLANTGTGIPSTDPNNSAIRIDIGVILPNKTTYPWSLQKIGPAIECAVEAIENRTDLVRPISFHIEYRDSNCSETNAPLAAFKLISDRSAHLFLGPSCPFALAPVARYSPSWNVPVITGAGLAEAFSNKGEFGLLTRMGGSYEKMGEFVASIMEAFKWRVAGLIFEENTRDAEKSEHFFIASSVYSAFLDHFRHPTWYQSFINAEFDAEAVLKAASLKGRILIICASPIYVRKLLLKAAELHYDDGQYVFFNVALFDSPSELEKQWYRAEDAPETNEKARRAYEMLMTVTSRRPDSDEYKRFSNEVKRRSIQTYNYTFPENEEQVNNYVGAFHDSVILYALAVNQTLAQGGDPYNGREITALMWNRTFKGVTGTVSIDGNGDRNTDYSLMDLDPQTEKFRTVANYYGSRKEYEKVEGQEIHWPGEMNQPPPDVPECGFDGKGCPEEEPFPEYAIVIIALGSLMVIISSVSFLVYRHFKLQSELAEENWRVRWEEVIGGSQHKVKLHRTTSMISVRRTSVHTAGSTDSVGVKINDVSNKQRFIQTGYYKANLVAIKKLQRTNININRALLIEIKTIKNLTNDHIVRVFGICIDVPNQCILTEYCQKGSLEDVLENEQINLDHTFKFSLLQDIVRGMSYLHSTEIKSHGNLKSSNCVVDSRFVLKLTDFGLHSLRESESRSEEEKNFSYYKGKLWTAPELLRIHNPPPEGTQKADVYSFAIICQEIFYRRGVFWPYTMDFSSQEIYRKVKDGQKPYFRPTLDSGTEIEENCGEDLANLIRKCWSEDPVDRPDFNSIKNSIRKTTRGEAGGNLLDNLLRRMEQYANNLESLVEERTADYLEQKKRAEDLLYLMLPKSVAGQLMRGESVTAEKFESVTIYFSDICGFTSLSADSSPMQVIDLLNDLYTTFDQIIDSFDVYKVETIGDAYMVVSGLPGRNGQNHAREIARMSIALLNAVKCFKIRHRPSDTLKLRIGIHSGSVCTGVVGSKMPRYCLFGDTVNTASRMESNGEALRIHLSPFTKEILDTFGTFVTQLRGPVDMKGKGTVVTWWLLGELNPEFPDFAPNESLP